MGHEEDVHDHTGQGWMGSARCVERIVRRSANHLWFVEGDFEDEQRSEGHHGDAALGSEEVGRSLGGTTG
jgi:hypothetical protein